MTSTEDPATVTTKDSPRSVSDTVERLIGLVEDRQMRIFAVIDQAAERACSASGSGGQPEICRGGCQQADR